MTTLSLQPDGTAGVDTMLSRVAPAVNYGGNATITIGNDNVLGQDVALRALLKFDLSSIPATAIVTGASLTLHRTGTGVLPSGNSTFTAYRATKVWGELTANWNTTDGSTPWTTGGGDYDSALSATCTVPQSGSSAVFSDMTELAQDAIDNRSGVLSLLIKGTEDVGIDQYIVVDSSDGATAGNRPQLVVEYFDLPLHYEILQAAASVITALALPTSPTVAMRKLPWSPPDKDKGNYPLIVVSHPGVETITPATNLRDDIGYPVLITMWAVDNKDLDVNPLYLHWRHEIIEAFRAQTLSGVSEVWRVQVNPKPIVDPMWFVNNKYQSSLEVRFFCRETRG